MKKEDNSEIKEKLKKVKDTFFLDIYIQVSILNFQPPMFNNEVCRAMTDKQTYKLCIN